MTFRPLDTCQTIELRIGDALEFPINSWTFTPAIVVAIETVNDVVRVKAASLRNKRKKFERDFSPTEKHALIVAA